MRIPAQLAMNAKFMPTVTSSLPWVRVRDLLRVAAYGPGNHRLCERCQACKKPTLTRQLSQSSPKRGGGSDAGRPDFRKMREKALEPAHREPSPAAAADAAAGTPTTVTTTVLLVLPPRRPSQLLVRSPGGKRPGKSEQKINDKDGDLQNGDRQRRTRSVLALT